MDRDDGDRWPGRRSRTSLGAGNQPAVAVLGASVAVSWTQTTLPDGVAVSGYEVTAVDASSGAARPVGGSCAGVIATTSCTDVAVPSGAWRYAVVPREDAWAGPASALSTPVTVDTTPPETTIAFPADGGAYTNVLWNAGCASGLGICGTAADALSGLASVRVSVLRESTGRYWNGSSFGGTSEVLLTPTGTSTWRYQFAGSSFPAEGLYTARVVATDTVGNAGSTSATFAIDRSVPTVAVVSPTASTTYGVPELDATCGICGTATDAMSSVANVRVSIRQGPSTYWDGTAFASSSEVFHEAIGTTSWTLPFSGSAFPASGTYTVRAVATDATGQTGTQSRSFTMDVVPPTVTALALVNGGGTTGLGKVSPGSDSIRLTFSERLSVGSVCSTWSGDTSNQSVNAIVTITDDGADDLLSVTAPDCALHVGPVSLGGSYVTSTSTFAGTVTWTASSRRITITIGAQSSGTSTGTAQPAGTAVYTPDAAITDSEWNPVVVAPFSATAQRL